MNAQGTNSSGDKSKSKTIKMNHFHSNNIDFTARIAKAAMNNSVDRNGTEKVVSTKTVISSNRTCVGTSNHSGSKTSETAIQRVDRVLLSRKYG